MARNVIIILGCSHLGALLATLLDQQGATVHVVDRDAARLSALPRAVRRLAVQADPLEAIVDGLVPVRDAAAAVAVTDSDDGNLALAIVCLRASTATTAIAHVREPARAASYASMGVRVVEGTRPEALAILRALGVAASGSDPWNVSDDSRARS
jgi:Trk K+ transport system NAD-binding subunit